MSYKWHKNNYPPTIYDGEAPDGTRIGGVTHGVVFGPDPAFHTSRGNFHTLEAAQQALIEAYEKGVAAAAEKAIVADGRRSIFCTPEPKHFDLVFAALYDGVISAGGDGDGALFCKYYNYKDVAELFKEYEVRWAYGTKKIKEIYTVSYDPDASRVLFCSWQECICIEQFGEKSDFDHWMDVVIVK